MNSTDSQAWLTSPFLIGAIGALVGLRFAPGLSWPERAFNVSTGAACAGFISPATAELFRLSSNHMTSALAFLMGAFAMAIMGALMQGLRDLKLAEIVADWFSRR